MVIWGVVIGALLGWVLSSFEFIGAAFGAGIGAIALNWLRNEVRSEIRDVVDRNEQELLARLELRADLRREMPVPRPTPPAFEPEAPEPAPLEQARPWGRAEDAEVAAPTPEPESAKDPGPVIDVIGMVRGWIFGGNTIVRVGLIILFVGLSFLARYAAMAGLFPIEARLALVAAAGIALLVTGFLRRTARPEFGLALQGAGVAVLYLTIFGAARFYDLLPLLPAFGLMLLVCALGCALAVLQGSLALALISFVGGFAVPLLLGGDGSSIGLFGYYAVLDVAVLVLVWRRGWRPLGLIAFFASFGVMGAWVADRYTPAEYASTQAFLVLFMLVHIGLALLDARRRPGVAGQIVDTTLLFGPALAGLGIQMALVRHLELGDAFSALGFAAVYIIVAAAVKRRGGANYTVLVDALLAIGIAALTLAVPLAFGAAWTSAVWAVEGAAAVWIGARQSRWLVRLFGLALIGVATLFFLSTVGANIEALPVIGRQTLGALLIAVSMMASAWWLRTPLPDGGSRWSRPAQEVEALVRAPLFIAGFLMWCFAIALEVYRGLPQVAGGDIAPAAVPLNLRSLVLMIGVLISAAVAQTIGRRLAWPMATWPSRVTLLVLALVFAERAFAGQSVVAWPDGLFWLAGIALHLFCLYRNDRPPVQRLLPLERVAHVGGVWLLVAMATNALSFGLKGFAPGSDWPVIAIFLSRIAVLALLALWAGRANRAAAGDFGWPLGVHAVGYWWQAALGVAALIAFNMLLVAFTASGSVAPLPYLPLLNPVDLSLALALGVLLLWRRVLAGAMPQPALARRLAGGTGMIMLAALGFLVINSVWLRIAHQYLDVPWALSAMLSDGSVQAGVAILWTLLALALMLFAHRRVDRPLWLTGAGLLGAVVLKLLFIDMSNAGGGQRIIAFIGVGVLMLIVGYFVPLPPKPKDAEMVA